MGVEQFEALTQKARQALADGNATLARQYYLQAMAESPDSPDVHYGLATACFLLNDLDAAAFHFKEVTRLDPLRAGAFINLGAVYNRMGQLDEAIKALRRGIQLDGRRAEAYYNLGLAYRRQGQGELAIQAYREATNLNPRMADAHYNLANLLLDIGRYSQAITHYKKALEIRPQWEKAQLGLQQAEAALAAAEAPAKAAPTPAASPTAAAPSKAATVDLNRTLDPQTDGPLLSVLHKATIDSQGYGKHFLEILEKEVEPAIKELSTCLLYPEKSAAELKDRLERFEAAMQNMRTMQRNLQQSMKKLREINDRLLESSSAPAPPG
jgi:tetratricopeptide (TPR) repeat protein